jgi:uncharacterized SAM-binding protein YcdF (DUF218 family)
MLDTIAYLLISPINQCILGVLLGFVLLKFSSRAKWLGKSFIFLSLIWTFLCSQYFFSYWLISPLENKFPPVKASSEKWQSSTAIWVLACYHFEALSLPLVSQFNDCSVQRLVQAANMYRIKQTPIYVTGSDFNKDTNLQHASQAAEFLMALGVSKSDITIVNKGSNTSTEAAYIVEQLSKQYINPSVAVVSSATHGLRLSKILDSSKILYQFIPVHFATKGEVKYMLNVPSISSLARSERAFYEYAALIKYYLKD